eukprot:TRINITY_DN9190_c0_g1_i1.p1 TRINITY_DN9190_c0_g1~~TRINITY_DN9190_c0_g1_i1.p1  ORF type:complete len:729 (+),score=164.84 TRINITY_DN9190_c0_g1_i1:52-2238(+)
MSSEESFSSNDIEVIEMLKPIDVKRQSIPISQGDEMDGEVRRHIDFVNGLLVRRNPMVRTLYENWRNGVDNYPENESFGTKQPDDTFSYITYAEADKIAHRVASGLYKLKFREGDHIGLYSKNSAYWVLTSEACHFQKYVSIALYDTLGQENIKYIMNHSELSIVFGTVDNLHHLLQVLSESEEESFLEYVVVYGFDDDSESDVKHDQELRELAEVVGVHVLDWTDILKMGKKHPVDPNPPEPEDLAIIMYTSGTTGNPKGVMLTHGNVMSTVDSGYLQLKGLHAPQDSYLSYLPLAHILERVNMAAMLQNGIRVGFYGGDPRKLSEDIACFKPSILAGVPRVFDRIYEGINARVESAGGIGKLIFKSAYKDREKAKAKGKRSKSLFDSIAFKKAKKALGGNVRIILSGGAPLSAVTQNFISTVFDCPVLQGYGLTETCAGCSISSPDDSEVGQVGPPIPSCEVKLVSVPDMNYTVQDKPPKGEVWIRGPNVSRGYYKNPEKTAEDFTEDGWFKTGDIGMWNDNGTLSIIDRKKNIFKLSQGEYVAVELLEGIYNRGRHTTQLWIYGNSEESTLVGVAVPNPLTIGELAPPGVDPNDLQALCEHPDVIATVLAEINQLATENNRAGFERIRSLYLYPEEFSTENDLATPTMKLKRPQLKEFFKDVIDRMYEEINSKEKGKPKKKNHHKKHEAEEKKPRTSRNAKTAEEGEAPKSSRRRRKPSVSENDS